MYNRNSISLAALVKNLLAAPATHDLAPFTKFEEIPVVLSTRHHIHALPSHVVLRLNT